MTVYLELSPSTRADVAVEYSRVRVIVPFLDAGDADDKFRSASAELELALLDSRVDPRDALIVVERDRELAAIATALAREFEMQTITRAEMPANPQVPQGS